jgi:hypothetical protein
MNPHAKKNHLGEFFVVDQLAISNTPARRDVLIICKLQSLLCYQQRKACQKHSSLTKHLFDVVTVVQF